MSYTPYFQMTAAVFAVAFTCLFVQKFFKRYLEPDQYYYLKDITLIGAWALFGIWTPDTHLRVTIAAAVVAGCVGFCQKVTNNRLLRCLYFLTGFAYAFFGPRIAFVETTGGEFLYLSNITSIIVCTLWVGVLPVFLQEIDEIPGMCGLLLTALWSVVSIVILSSPQHFQALTQLCITGLVFLFVFWSRHIHAYRRLTESLCAFWGTLFAGLTIYAVSRGITTWTLVAATAGMLFIPVLEISACVLSAIFTRSPVENAPFYRKLTSHGIDHATGIYVCISACTAISCIIVCIMLRGTAPFAATGILFAMFVLTGIYFKFRTERAVEAIRKPSLWGITVDNISLNYALGRVQHWIETEKSAHLIITPDALAALRSRTDRRYREACSKAGLMLPDGAGLISALKLMGTPIQERLPGCEFVEHLCKRAAHSGWKVFFFGGKPGVAEAAAKKMQEKYDGLTVAGCRNGYFKDEDTADICEEIKNSGAEILFVGLGVPKQEYWLTDNLEKTSAFVGMGIGGSMDVISGNLKRAPKKWQKMKLEWLYRTIQEPYRWRRLLGLPVFVFRVVLTKLHLDNYKDNQ